MRTSACLGSTASRHGQRTVASVALTNTDANARTDLAVSIEGVSVRSASGELLTAPAVDSANLFGDPNVVSPKSVHFKTSGGRLALRLPPKSVTVVQVDQ